MKVVAGAPGAEHLEEAYEERPGTLSDSVDWKIHFFWIFE